jgi:LPXTG-motif cell wall-anchored protein
MKTTFKIKKVNKIKLAGVTVLTALTLGSSIVALPNLVNAAGDGTTTKDLIVHKVANNGEINNENNGSVINDPWASQALAGAGFTVYDITADFYGKLSTLAGATTKEKYEAYVASLKHKSNTELANLGTVAKTEIVDGQTGETKDGQVTFGDLPMKSNGHDAIYVVVETTRPANTTNDTNVIGSISTVFSMPLNGNETQIHLYPKNEIGKPVKTVAPADENAATDQAAINYTLQINLPNDLGTVLESGKPKFKSFTLIEKPGKFLSFDALTTVEVDGTVYPTVAAFEAAYGLTSTPSRALPVNGSASEVYNLVFTPDSAAGTVGSWSDLGGKTIVFGAQGHIDVAGLTASNITNPIENDFTYSVTDDNGFTVTPDDDKEEVKLGSYQFAKTDSENGAYLAGAEFTVKQGTKDIVFLEVSPGVYTAVPAGTAGAVSTVTVDTTGKLSLLGLDADLEYSLTETKSPNGYFMLTDSIKFTPLVDDNDSDVSSDKTLNGNDTDGFYNIYNTPNNVLPSTGGTGFMIFSAVAVLGLGGAGVLYLMKRRNANQA